MKPDDSIHSLIRSLSSPEKRFLRKLGKSTPGDDHYLLLFDLIDRQEVYDEKLLKKKLQEKGVAQNLAWEKNYLNRQIFRSLRAYHNGPWAILEALDYLKSVEILYRKLQLKSCAKLVAKGIELCAKFEMWNLHLEFYEWQYRLAARRGMYDFIEKTETARLAKKQYLHACSVQYGEMQELIYHIVPVLNSTTNMTQPEKSAYALKTLKKIREIEKKTVNSFRLREQLYAAASACALLRRDSETDFVYCEKLVHLFSEHPHFIHDTPYRYYAATINYVNCLDRLGEWDKAEKEIKRLKAFVAGVHKAVKIEMELHALSGIMNNETSILLATERPGKALEVVKEYERSRVRLRKMLRKSVTLADDIYITRVYFRNKMFDKCRRLLAELFSESKNTLNPEYFLSASLLRICVHAASGKWEIISYFADSAKRMTDKLGIHDAYAAEFLRIMKALARNNGMILDRKKFHDEITALAKMITFETWHYKDMQWFLEGLETKQL